MHKHMASYDLTPREESIMQIGPDVQVNGSHGIADKFQMGVIMNRQKNQVMRTPTKG